MNDKPTFKAILGGQWATMPAVFHRRYANRPFSNDEVVVEGLLNVHASKWMKFLSPMLRVCGALIPYPGQDIPVTVKFNSDPVIPASDFVLPG